MLTYHRHGWFLLKVTLKSTILILFDYVDVNISVVHFRQKYGGKQTRCKCKLNDTNDLTCSLLSVSLNHAFSCRKWDIFSCARLKSSSNRLCFYKAVARSAFTTDISRCKSATFSLASLFADLSFCSLSSSFDAFLLQVFVRASNFCSASKIIILENTWAWIKNIRR